MTIKKALSVAQARWGKTAQVRASKDGCYIGQHGEFLQLIFVGAKDRKRSDGTFVQAGHYWCQPCNTTHEPAKMATCYSVGKIMLGMFLEIRGDGLTWEDAFKEADKFDNRFKAIAAS